MIGLKDVALRAGVSVSTVSRVLTNASLVNAETRERVQAAIDALGYRPNRVARRLRADAGQAALLGLVVPDVRNPFFADVVSGVEEVAEAHGYMVFLGNSEEDAAAERRYLELMRAERVDGVILPPTSDTAPHVAELARTGLPVVCVDRRLPRVALDTVIADNVQGAYGAAAHLLDIGHRRIGVIGGRPHLSTSQERLEGVRRAHEERGVPLDPALLRTADSYQTGGRQAARELLALAAPPTALFVANNLMTLGALETIHGLGLRIPDDVAIVGYDDMPWALALNPPLTAVRQPAVELGRRAAELLLQRIADPGRSTTLVTLQPELVVRQSCGAGREVGIRSRVRRHARAAAPALDPT